MSDDALKDFVLQMCNNQIFTNLQCPTEMIGMVFMPLMLGGLKIPEETLENLKNVMPPKPGDKPKHLEKPKPPDNQVLPKKPKQSLIEPDPIILADIEKRIEWQQTTIEERDNYLNKIEAERITQQLENTAVLALWEQACKNVEQTILEKKSEYERALAEWDKKEEDFNKELTEWTIANARYEFFYKGLIEGFTEDIGLMWEYLSKAVPMSVNGYPSFYSLHLMSKTDWNRANKAVQKELKRRIRMVI
jgi:hypothetical protein